MALRICVLLLFLTGLPVGASATVGQDAAAPGPATPTVCPVTAPQVQAAPVAGAAPAGTTWYAGTGLWVGLDPGYGGRWHTRPDGLKVFWVREARGILTVTGRRLDAPAPPLDAWIPSGYGDISLQISGLTFPSVGCWEVDGQAGTGEVRIVVAVAPAPVPEGRATPVACGHRTSWRWTTRRSCT